MTVSIIDPQPRRPDWWITDSVTKWAWIWHMAPQVVSLCRTEHVNLTGSHTAVQGLLGVCVLLWHAVQSFADTLILSCHWSYCGSGALLRFHHACCTGQRFEGHCTVNTAKSSGGLAFHSQTQKLLNLLSLVNIVAAASKTALFCIFPGYHSSPTSRWKSNCSSSCVPSWTSRLPRSKSCHDENSHRNIN